MPLTFEDRLRRLGMLSGTTTAAAAAVRAPSVPVDRTVPGEEVVTPFGPCVERTSRFDGLARHGALQLSSARGACRKDLSVVGRLPAYTDVPPERRLYLDTETTSLSGGAGVLVFLVGVGRFEGDDFVVHQLFMRDPSEEDAMLDRLAMFIDEADALVSFCGKSFDAPRARDRFLFQNRPDVEAALRRLHHLDLHPTARRLFSHRLPDNRLRTYEEEELGFRRTSDLPGAECPEAYFAYQRGTGNRIDEIMEHNLHDILSLATLEARIAEAYATPCDARMALAAGILAVEGSDMERARCHLVRAAADLPPLAEHLPMTACLRGAGLLKRLEEFESARRLLEKVMVAWPADLRPVEALAILHDRSLRDVRGALSIVERGLVVAHDPTDRARLLHRHRRLRGRSVRA